MRNVLRGSRSMPARSRTSSLIFASHTLPAVARKNSYADPFTVYSSIVLSTMSSELGDSLPLSGVFSSSHKTSPLIFPPPRVSCPTGTSSPQPPEYTTLPRIWQSPGRPKRSTRSAQMKVCPAPEILPVFPSGPESARADHAVTPLACRLAATWTGLTGIVRLLAAYNLNDPT